MCYVAIDKIESHVVPGHGICDVAKDILMKMDCTQHGEQVASFHPA